MKYLEELVLDGSLRGENQFYSQLFSLDELFEKLVRRRVTESLAGTGFQLEPKSEVPGVLRRLSTNRLVGSCSADLVISSNLDENRLRNASHNVLIGDVKWKRLARDEDLKPGNQDLFQIAFYLHRYVVKGAVIVYPKSDWMAQTPEVVHEEFEIVPGRGVLTIFTVSVWHLLLPRGTPGRSAAEKSLRELMTVVLTS